MAEKNTLAILENIKKKIQKLDEPKKQEGKDFSDLGDEFNYTSSTKKDELLDVEIEVNENKVEEALIEDNLKQESKENFIEENSIIDDEEESFLEDQEDDFDEKLDEEVDLDDNETGEDEEVFEKEQLFDNSEDEDLPNFEEEYIENSLENQENQQPILQEESKNNYEEFLDKKTDEDELGELLNQENSIEEKASIPSQPSNQEVESESNDSSFLVRNSKEGLLNYQAAANISDSIKKLVDAKNVVSGVTSFSKSDAFTEIASQLMEPRLEKWLNENLPSLVEKIVRDEIKKIIPKE